MTNDAAWSYAAVLGEHAAEGLGFHVESLAFRGATLSEMLAQAAKGFTFGKVIAGDDAPESSSLSTVRPSR